MDAGRKKSEYQELTSNELRNIPRGLRNVGNTCYFNSVIQPLCHSYTLYHELDHQRGELTRSFCEVCQTMRIESSESFAPEKLRDQFAGKVSRFDNHRQHDSHECLRHFLDEIRKEERSAKDTTKISDPPLTAVDKIFGGHLVTVYICKECDKHYHLFEPCLDISLPVFFEIEKKEARSQNIEKNGTTTKMDCVSKKDDTSETKEDNYKLAIQKLTAPLSSLTQINNKLFKKVVIGLDDCLEHFCKEEQICKEYLCEDCLGKAMVRGEADADNLKLTSATKQTLIFNPPAILTIHFKRFELLPGRSRKRSDMVEYPVYLDIAPYCSSQCLRNDPPRNNIWYSLYAVVVHSGSLESGHYVAYVKMRDIEENVKKLEKFIQKEYFNHNISSDELIKMMNNDTGKKNTDKSLSEIDEGYKWYSINDASVREVSVKNVLEQEAYLLFYERVEDAKIVHSPSPTKAKPSTWEEIYSYFCLVCQSCLPK